MKILQAMTDPNLFGPHFRDIESWRHWIVVLRAALGEPLDTCQQQQFQEFTGREWTPQLDPSEIWLIVGRRGGKSKIVALLAVVLALFKDHSEHLTPGEAGLVMVIAVDRKQAKVVLRYIEAYIDSSPLFSAKVLRKTAESIELNNRVHITVGSCSIRSVRGYTVLAAIADEIAFWRDERSANPDAEVLNAIRPAMATIPNAKLICLSSPYARRGAMWEAYRQYYGQDSNDVLVWQAGTQDMNPGISRQFLERERARDPVSYQAEYLAQFRTDVASALDPNWIDSALCLPNLDVPVSPHPRHYVGFADMSGGRSDSATLAIGHTEPEDDSVYIDLVRRWTPPFSPEAVVTQMATLLKSYRLGACVGDNYAAELVVELFAKRGIAYARSTDSASQIYAETFPLFSTGQLRVPDHPVLRSELSLLERRTRSGGKDQISHPPGGHDDLANAVCGAALHAWRQRALGSDLIYAVPRTFDMHGVALTTDYPDDIPWRDLL